MKKFAFTTAALFLAATGAANAATYTDEATFLANIQGDYYLEDFNGWGFGTPLNGSQLTWSAPGNGIYGWDASAALGLFSVPGALSTQNEEDTITITFTGAPVTAFGGFFFDTDFNGLPMPGTMTINLSNGESYDVVSAANNFFGWTGPVAISSIVINDVPGVKAWPTIDHFYVGSAVPAPGALALLGLAGLVGGRRRR